jgi:heme A synthase
MQEPTPKLARFAWATLAYNVLVILWGAYVRATGSGAGCGAHWPLCNGETVPTAPAIATIIEYTHRVTSGLALVLAIALVVAARRATPVGSPVRRAAHAVLFFELTEAAVGASIVLLRYVAHDASAPRAIWVGIHLVNTFLLVAALLLAAMRASGLAPERLATPGRTRLLGFAVVLTLIVGATGAITALGDTLFPAESLTAGMEADLSPGAHFLVRLRVIHPLLAVATALTLSGLAGLVIMERPSPLLRRAAIALVGSQVLQILVGLVNLALLAPISVQMWHLFFADVTWMALVLFVDRALAEPAKSAAKASAPSTAESSVST